VKTAVVEPVRFFFFFFLNVLLEIAELVWIGAGGRWDPDKQVRDKEKSFQLRERKQARQMPHV